MLAIFALAYLLVIAEEAIHLRKSKPVVIAAGLIWTLLAAVYTRLGQKSACGPVIIQFRFTEPTFAVTLDGMAASHGNPVLLRY